MKLDLLDLYTHLLRRKSWDKNKYITIEMHSERIVWQDGEPFKCQDDLVQEDWEFVYLNKRKWCFSTVKPQIVDTGEQLETEPTNVCFEGV